MESILYHTREETGRRVRRRHADRYFLYRDIIKVNMCRITRLRRDNQTFKKTEQVDEEYTRKNPSACRARPRRCTMAARVSADVKVQTQRFRHRYCISRGAVGSGGGAAV